MAIAGAAALMMVNNGA